MTKQFPQERNRNSSALGVLSKLFGIARALMTVETKLILTSLKTFGDALSCRVAGQT